MLLCVCIPHTRTRTRTHTPSVCHPNLCTRRRTALLLDQVDQDRAPKGSRIPDSHFNRLRGSLVRSFGFKSKAEIWYTLRQKGGLVTVLRRGFSGVGAHTVGNIGPDVFCMGATSPIPPPHPSPPLISSTDSREPFLCRFGARPA
jgi:hypothetical protein